MAYEFKKLSDVEVVETAADTANVLIEEDGVIKKVAKSEVGGNSEPDGTITCSTIPCYITSDALALTQFDFATIKEKIIAEEEVFIRLLCIYSYGDNYKTLAKSNSVYYNSTSDTISIAWQVAYGTSSDTISCCGVSVIIDSTGTVTKASYVTL